MPRVAVAGVGMSKFGEYPSDPGDIKGFGEKAVLAALEDSGIPPSEVLEAFVGSIGLMGLVQANLVGNLILERVGISKIPITRLEGGCASASMACRLAYQSVKSGLCDVALALGVEKMLTKAPTEQRLKAMILGSDLELEGRFGITFPGVFGMMATRRMAFTPTSREHMAKVAIKNHKNAMNNPYAHMPKDLTLGDVLGSRPVAYPLTLFECCPMSDGAACAILVGEELAKGLKKPPVWILASEQTSGDMEDDFDGLTLKSSVLAAKKAYGAAGLGPADISLAEVHDCFSIAEIQHYEELGFAPFHEGGRLLEEGETEIGGRIPVNPSGGLLGRGHPVGATGLAQVAEAVWQLRGEASGRQVKGASVALTHTMGNFTRGDAGATVVQIFSLEPPKKE